MSRLKSKRGAVCYDVGAVRIRQRWQGRRHFKVRYIKVRNGPPVSRRWIPLARHTWLQTYGPIPPGLRVVHLDGDTLNDSLDNYALMSPGEFINHCHRLNPEMSRENRREARGSRLEELRRHNRDRGAVLRARRAHPNYWYAVDDQRKVIFNRPFKSRRLLYLHWGVQVPINGVVPRQAALPVRVVRGRCLNTPEFRSYKRQKDGPTVKTEADLETLSRAGSS